MSSEADSFMSLPPQPARSIIGQITHHLSHMADMVYAIDEVAEEHHTWCIAFVDSFLLDFRALYYFLLGRREKGDAHRFNFADIKTWQRPSTDATRRMDKLVDFISKHRAHLSNRRFAAERESIESLLGVRRVTAEFLARTLLDYLDILDSFIRALPDAEEAGKQAWFGAAHSARYKVKLALGLRQSDFPDAIKPLKSVQACR